MISRHIAFLAIVSIFMAIAMTLINYSAEDTDELFQWGIFIIMSLVGIALGRLFVYEDW